MVSKYASFFKKTWIYLLIIFSCIACYIVSRSMVEKIIVEKEITYTSITASEVYIAWGTMRNALPPNELWPPDSHSRGGMIYTKMGHNNGKFTTTLSLPSGTCIYYWIVQRKDKEGNETDIWESPGASNDYYSFTFSYDSFINPGYFIFLAGFIPLLLLYFRTKNTVQPPIAPTYNIKEYVSQFDSIRAIAVLLVIVHHWVPSDFFLNFLENGRLGVNIFFALSGFLITGILLKAKNQIEEQGVKKSTVFRNFYARRTLRIFPIYYLLLVILWILNDPGIKENAVYYFTYTSNYLFYTEQFFPNRLAHLWSLAVEEQFYIFWPWLIILVNKKYLPYLISLFLVIGISSNYIFTSKDWWVEIFTPTCFDAFAIGGFLSYLVAYQPYTIQTLQLKFRWIFCIVLFLFILDAVKYSFLPSRTSHALLTITVIYYCLFKNNNRIMNYILNNKWLIRIGKISYGVYLYHLFIPELWGGIIKKIASLNIDLLYNHAMPEAIKPAWLFIQHFSFLMIICILSWKLIEKPINQLKKWFEYKTTIVN